MHFHSLLRIRVLASLVLFFFSVLLLSPAVVVYAQEQVSVPPYRLLNLQKYLPTNGYASPVSLNNKSQVLVLFSYFDDRARSTLFIIDLAKKTVTDIGNPLSSSGVTQRIQPRESIYIYSSFGSINDLGQVISTRYNTETSQQETFLFDPKSGIKIIPFVAKYLPGPTFNNKGQVVGEGSETEVISVRDTSGEIDKVSFSEDVLAGYRYINATGITDSRLIAGSAHAVIWQGKVEELRSHAYSFDLATNMFVDLHKLLALEEVDPLASSTTSAVSGNGLMLVHATYNSGETFVQEYDLIDTYSNSFKILPEIATDNYNSYLPYRYFKSVNSSGAVVGDLFYVSKDSNVYRGTSLFDGEDSIDLNCILPAQSGKRFVGASAINDKGWILVSYARNNNRAHELYEAGTVVPGILVPTATKYTPYDYCIKSSAEEFPYYGNNISLGGGGESGISQVQITAKTYRGRSIKGGVFLLQRSRFFSGTEWRTIATGTLNRAGSTVINYKPNQQYYYRVVGPIGTEYRQNVHAVIPFPPNNGAGGGN